MEHMQEEEVVDLFDENLVEDEVVKNVEPEPKQDDEPKFEIPEKFKGKSIEEVIQSYTHLEKENGRRANEIGELRKLTDEFLQQQVERGRAKSEDLESDIESEVGFDDLIDNPGQAVEKVLSKNPRLRRIEENMLAQEADIAHKRVAERHPDVDDIVVSEEFGRWLQESPGRLRTFQTAREEMDAGLASDLLDMYKATRKVATEQALEERDAQAKADLKSAVVESGSAGGGSKKKIYRRADLIRLKQTDPARYREMYPEIHQAYAEKRVR